MKNNTSNSQHLIHSHPLNSFGYEIFRVKTKTQPHHVFTVRTSWKNRKAYTSCIFGYVPQKVRNFFVAEVTHIPEPFDTVW